MPRAGRPRCRSSSPGGVKNFLFSAASRPALGLTQPPTQWIPGALSPDVMKFAFKILVTETENNRKSVDI
jgi:hypothetical protein